MNLTNSTVPGVVVEEKSVTDQPIQPDTDDEFLEVFVETCDTEQTDLEETAAISKHINVILPSQNYLNNTEQTDLEKTAATSKQINVILPLQNHVSSISAVQSLFDDKTIPSRGESNDKQPYFPSEMLNGRVKDLNNSQVAVKKLHQNLVTHNQKENCAITSFPSQTSRKSEELSDSDGKLYKCSVCSMQFARHSSLVWHIQSHRTPQNLKEKKSDDNNSFTNDDSTQSLSSEPIIVRNGVYICELCHKEFEFLRSVRVHITRCHKFEVPVDPAPDYNLNSTTCYICDREFESVKAMKIHISHVHTRVDTEYPNEKGMFSCNLCNKQFVSTRARSVHMSHMHRSPSVASVQVDKSNSIAGIDSPQNEFGMFACNECGKEFSSSTARKIHVSHMHKRIDELVLNSPSTIRLTPKENVRFICEYCNKIFDTLKGKSVHISHMHKLVKSPNDTAQNCSNTALLADSATEENGLFICEYCDKEFDSAKGKKVHVSRLHKFEAPEDPAPDEETTAYSCEYCYKEFASSKAVRVHVWHMHKFTSKVKTAVDSSDETSILDEGNLFDCEFCDRIFESPKARQIHVLEAHQNNFTIENAQKDSFNSTLNEDGPSECEFCSREFSSVKALKIHKSHKHSFTDGAYNCKICDKGFASFRAKKVHMLRLHKGQPCDEIPMELTKEVPMSNGETVFPCHLCGRTFWNKKGVSRHMGYHATAVHGLSKLNNTCNDVPSTSINDSTENYSSVLSVDKDVVSGAFQCPVCKKAGFETIKAVKIHSSRMHSGVQLEFGDEIISSTTEIDEQNFSFNCDHCDKKFRTELGKTVHSVRMHKLKSRQTSSEDTLVTSKEINNLECVFCKYSFETVQAMNIHIKVEHSNSDSFPCIICKKIFASLELYDIHVLGLCGKATNINGAFMFPCEQCSEVFFHPKNVQEHLICDHGLEPEILLDEEENFELENSSHQNSIGNASQMEAFNDGESVKMSQVAEQFDCSFCDKSFYSIKARCAHLKVHTRHNRQLRNTTGEPPEKLLKSLHGEIHNNSNDPTSSSVSTNVSSPSEQFENLHAEIFNDESHHASTNVPTNTSFDITKTEQTEFKCPRCPKSFNKSKALANHSRIHEFQCQICSKSFISIKPLQLHMKNHDQLNYGGTGISMPSTNGEKVDQLAENMNVSAKMNGEVLPEYQNSASMAENTEISVKKEEYKCSYCPRSFKNLKAITTHSRSHSGGKNISTVFAPPPTKSIEMTAAENDFRCSYCNKLFMNAKAVAVHSRIHKFGSESQHSNQVSTLINEAKPNQCKICLKSFETERGLHFHSNVHSGTIHQCSLCERTFNNVKGLAGHMKIHKGAAKEVVQVTLDSNEDEQEEEIDESGGNSFSCESCDRVFTTQRGRARHAWIHLYESAHNKESSQPWTGKSEQDKLFECRYCGARFSNGKQLGGHMRHHTIVLQKDPSAYDSVLVDTDGIDVELNGEDQLICDTCDEVFECKEDLSEHVRNHTLDPLSMGDTETNQSMSEALDQHDSFSSAHSTQGRYMMCHVCNQLFSSEENLTAHMLKKHRWANRKATSVLPQKDLSTPTFVSQNHRIVSTSSRKRSLSPEIIDLENDSIEDPIYVPAANSKRICSSHENEQAEVEKSAPLASSKSAFGVRKNGEIYAKNQPNLSAQFCESSYECMYCKQRFDGKSKFLEHVRTHPESKEYNNEDLESYTNTRNSESFVLQNQDGNDEHFVLEQCEDANGYRCTECEETFLDKLQMLIHISYHRDSRLPNGEQKSLLIKADSSVLAPFKCNFCGQRFINKKYRNLHLCKHHRSDLLQCEICQKLFICKETLKQHEEQHAQEKRYQCEFCGECFASKSILKRHSDLECQMNSNNDAGISNVQRDEHNSGVIVDPPVIKEEPRQIEDDFVDNASENVLRSNNTPSTSVTPSRENPRDLIDQKFKTETIGLISFVCDCCNKKFACEVDMQAHESHPQKILFCCGLCNLYFVDCRSAEVHSKMHIVESDLDLD